MQDQVLYKGVRLAMAIGCRILPTLQSQVHVMKTINTIFERSLIGLLKRQVIVPTIGSTQLFNLLIVVADLGHQTSCFIKLPFLIFVIIL